MFNEYKLLFRLRYEYNSSLLCRGYYHDLTVLAKYICLRNYLSLAKITILFEYLSKIN